MVFSKKATWSHIATLSILLLVIGLSFFSSFGISYDEPAMRMHGIATAKDVRNQFLGNSSFLELTDSRFSAIKKPELDNPDAKAHPVALELLLVSSEYLFGTTNDKDLLWKTRHLMTFSINSISMIILFLLIARRFESYFAGYLGVFVFLTSPRMFGDLFYNNKDMFFSTTYLLASYFSFRFITKPKLVLGALAGLFVGLSASIRLVGLTVVLASVLTLVINRKNCMEFKYLFLRCVAYCLSSIVSLTLFLPYLWENTFSRLLELPANATSFNWVGNTFFNGKRILSNDLPWNYIPLWISVTTPPIVFLLSILGCSYALLVFANSNFFRIAKFDGKKLNLLDSYFILLLFIPLASAVILNVTIYNGWRHFYFLYPFLVYFALLLTFTVKSNSGIAHKALILGLIFSVVANFSWIIRFGPVSSVYFNVFAGSKVEQRWETDYWAISNREILERVSELDQGEIVLYDWNNSPLYDSKVFLDELASKRISLLRLSDDPRKSDYIVDRSNSCEVSGDFCIFDGGIVTTRVIERLVGSAQVYSVYKVENALSN